MLFFFFFSRLQLKESTRQQPQFATLEFDCWTFFFYSLCCVHSKEQILIVSLHVSEDKSKIYISEQDVCCRKRCYFTVNARGVAELSCKNHRGCTICTNKIFCQHEIPQSCKQELKQRQNHRTTKL